MQISRYFQSFVFLGFDQLMGEELHLLLGLFALGDIDADGKDEEPGAVGIDRGGGDAAIVLLAGIVLVFSAMAGFPLLFGASVLLAAMLPPTLRARSRASWSGRSTPGSTSSPTKSGCSSPATKRSVSSARFRSGSLRSWSVPRRSARTTPSG